MNQASDLQSPYGISAKSTANMMFGAKRWLAMCTRRNEECQGALTLESQLLNQLQQPDMLSLILHLTKVKASHIRYLTFCWSKRTSLMKHHLSFLQRLTKSVVKFQRLEKKSTKRTLSSYFSSYICEHKKAKA